MTSIFHHLRVLGAVLVLACGALPGFAATTTVSDVDAPDGDYGVGAIIDVTVTFTAPVTVTGVPTLSLALGTTTRVVNYGSGSGTAILHFQYTVQAGDNSADLDYISTAALQLASGTIQDGTPANADVTLAQPGFLHSLGDNSVIVVDTVPATVLSVTTTKAPGLYGVTTVPIVVTFSKPVTTSTVPTLTLNTSPNAVVNYASGSGSSALTFTYTSAATQVSNHLDYVSSTALAGAISNLSTSGVTPATLTLPAPNASGSLGANSTIAINTNADATAPTVLGISSTNGNGTYATGNTIVVLVAMSEPVNVTGSPLLQLNDIGIGATDPVATFVDGTGSSVLRFSYVVGSTDATRRLDELSPSALLINGGSIQDIGPNAAVLAVPAPGATGSLGATKAIAVNLDNLPSGKPLAASVVGVSTPKGGGCGLSSALGAVLAALALTLHGRLRRRA